MGRVLVLCSVLLGLAALTVGAEERNMLVNGDFAVDANHDGLADGWQAAGEDGATVTYTRDAGAREGYSQQVASAEGSKPVGLVMLSQRDTFALKKDSWYRLTLNAKGETESDVVHVGVHQTNPWRRVGLWESFRLRPEWGEQEFVFRANRDIAKDVRLQIWFEGLGTLWVDDVRLEELGPEQPASVKPRLAEVVPSRGAKNLVPNGSFEAGGAGWGSMAETVGWGSNLGTRVGQADGTAAVDGEHSYRLEVDKATAPVLAWDYGDVQEAPVLRPLVANRGWITVAPGQSYTLSAFVKASPAGTHTLAQARGMSREWLQ